jgi:putative hydrolase of the HAD superfamily
MGKCSGLEDRRLMDNSLEEIIRRHSQPLTPLPTDCPPVLKPLIGVKAVLFDVYGTLFISSSGDVGTASECGRAAAFADALAAVGICYRGTAAEGVARLTKFISREHARMRDEGVDEPEVEIREIWAHTLRSLFDDGLVDIGDADEERLSQLALHYEVRANPVWPMPGLRDCLETLRESGRQLGLISNAQYFTPMLFQACLGQTPKELGLQYCFYSFESRRAKPGRSLYDAARKALAQPSTAISASEVLYLGNDMLNDVYAANLAGFRTALFAGDARSLRLRTDDQRVAGVVPDLVLTDLSQLGQCLSPSIA